MSRSRRLGQWLGRLALALQLGVSGLPLVDAALFHGAGEQQTVHVEAAGSSCHAGDCVLGQTLQSAGEAFLGGAIAAPLGDVVVVAERLPAPPVAQRASGIPIGPRAPPSHS